MRTPNGSPITITKASEANTSSATYRAEYDADVAAITWYDRSQRLWTTYAVDGDGHQVGDAEYSVERSDAFRDLDWVMDRYGAQIVADAAEAASEERDYQRVVASNDWDRAREAWFNLNDEASADDFDRDDFDRDEMARADGFARAHQLPRFDQLADLDQATDLWARHTDELDVTCQTCWDAQRASEAGDDDDGEAYRYDAIDGVYPPGAYRDDDADAATVRGLEDDWEADMAARYEGQGDPSPDDDDDPYATPRGAYEAEAYESLDPDQQRENDLVDEHETGAHDDGMERAHCPSCLNAADDAVRRTARVVPWISEAAEARDGRLQSRGAAPTDLRWTRALGELGEQTLVASGLACWTFGPTARQLLSAEAGR